MWSTERDTLTYGTQPVNLGFLGVPYYVPVSLLQGFTDQERIDWLTTWRARLGWGNEWLLWYATAGVAWAKIESNYQLGSTPGDAVGLVWGLPGGYAAANFSTIKTGWVVGGR